MDYGIAAYAFGVAAALLVGLSKTGVPGVGIPAILLMTWAFAGDEKLSVGALLPVLLVGDVFAVAFYRRHAQWKKLVGLFPYVLLGMVPGVVVLLAVDNSQFKQVLGWLILGLLAMETVRQWRGWTGVPHRWWFSAGIGTLAGFGTTVGNAAGPAMSVYLVASGLPKQQFMGTWAWFFLIVNVTKVPIYTSLGMITPATLAFDAAIALAAVVGALVGKRLLTILPQRLFETLVLALAAVAALNMVGVHF